MINNEEGKEELIQFKMLKSNEINEAKNNENNET